jgi:Zn-dependent alcohol dehydrogenase
MRAAVCRAFGEALSIEEVQLADPQPGEVEVEIRACAICHSDITYARGGWGGELPAVYGHEAAGVVRRIGAGVRRLRPGDHVVVTLIRACGDCPGCRRGRPVVCSGELPLDQRVVLRDAAGAPLVQGLRTAAFAERVLVHESQLARIPPDMPFELAALLGCGVITGYGAAVHTAGVRPGETVVVIGAGGVGLNAIQGARIAGARCILALDLNPKKREAALAFGATAALDPADPGVIAEVRGRSGGGADHVLVTVGAPAAFQQAFDLVAKGGTIVWVGMPASGCALALDPGDVAGAGLRILGSKMGDVRIADDIPALIELWQQRRLLLEPLISARYPLEEVNAAMAAVERGEALRNVLVLG